jgi:hypothetical protein
VCPVECEQEVVKYHFVRYINGSELKAPLVLLAMKNVVVADRDIKHMTGSNEEKIDRHTAQALRQLLDLTDPLQNSVATISWN